MAGLSSLQIGWLNRAAEYYVAARHLMREPLFGPAAFCGYHAIELMLKLALIRHDASFVPRETGHALAKMVRMLNNKTRVKPPLHVPEYFYHQQRLLSVARYPRHGRGVLLPIFEFIEDLDRVFAELACLVGIPRNTRLAVAALSPRSRLGQMLAEDNSSIDLLRSAVQR